MKTSFLRGKLALAVASVILAGVLPSQAAKHLAATQDEVFQVTATTKITVGTDRRASLQDLKVGDKVSITYEQANGVLTAHHIADNVPPKPHNPKVPTTPTVPHPAKKPSVFSHARGIIESLNAQGGTVTIASKVK